MNERYFLMGTDSSCRPLPVLFNFRENIKLEYINEKMYHKQDRACLIRIKHSFMQKTIYPDILDHEIFMLSGFAWSILGIYEPQLDFREVYLIEEKTNEIHEYIVPILKDVECLSEKTEFKYGRSIARGVLVKEKIPDLAIFRIPYIDGLCTVARLDFVESLLKRKAEGICLQRLEVE